MTDGGARTRRWGIVAVVLALLAAVARLIARRPRRVAYARIVTDENHTVFDGSRGVRSVQEADLLLPTSELDAIWTPMHLERLAATYWRWLTRATLGLVRVHYSPEGRQVKALGLIPLLTFQEPEYEMSDVRGIVRWRIDGGLLVAARGGGKGYLEIDMRRRPSRDYEGQSIVHVEVAVVDFHPAIAFALGRWLYENTQSRIHVIVTHGFLRNLARLDLAESKVGRLVDIDDLPDPPPDGGDDRAGAPAVAATRTARSR